MVDAAVASRTAALALSLLLVPAIVTAAEPVHRHGRRIEDGPGAGPWERRAPEDLGLDGPALDAAEEYLNEEMAGRQCFMVVKDGYIVKEAYRLGHTESSVRSAASVTKSLCSLMYGMAVQQGWANVDDLVRDRNTGGTRQCAADADFRHVLTMTGRSIDPPVFQYDASGTACLDTVADFFAENNPQGLDPNEWKDRFFREALGWQDSDWSGGFRCGSSVQASCRDLARAAQLLLNDGFWPGAGQLVDRDYALESSRMIYPDSGAAYGYLHWLNPLDPVDPSITNFGGAASQCVYVSRETRSVVVSMGQGTNSNCEGATDPRVMLPWAVVRDIVAQKSAEGEGTRGNATTIQGD